MTELTDNAASRIESRVDHWVRRFVIDLELCPFAKHVVDSESIRYKVSPARSDLNLIADLEAELCLLQQNQDIATSLLIAPYMLQGFEEYLDFLDHAEHLLEESNFVSDFQLASFHPLYQFADTALDAPENFSNRAPYPVIHILRESQVELAVDAYGDASAIPARNILTLQKMGSIDLSNLMKKLLASST
jgi:hypothetical protein